MMQHSFFLCKCLHPADVGAVSDRPRAINNRPYEFYCRFCVFYNTPIFYCWISRLQALLRAFKVLQETMVQIDAIIWALF